MTEKRTGRPVVLPRGEMTPLGRVLTERGISPKAVGEAIAIAEKKSARVLSGRVNQWIYGRITPSPLRQRLLAQWLKVPLEDLFPPPPKRERPKPPPRRPDLQLLEAAAETELEIEDAGQDVITRATAQETLTVVGEDGSPSMHYRALPSAKRRRATKSSAPTRRAA